MIVVDSSVWIDYFNGVASRETDTLDALLGVEALAVGDVILAEVLQGFRSDADYKIAKSLMSSLIVVEMLGEANAIKCAEHYRALRKRGVTIRKTIDVFIATYSIENQCPLLFQDQDFLPFVEHMSLLPVIKCA
ncbi:PIN domain nuclease [Acidithiobacillus sp. CV18-2]|uniref:PIN domain nuclease n=1 Tax=Igneacidithiobacillus copahuensis TaxID=2724909 RepID=A0AAE2YML5_9PROT|nr:PIN domain nuclease [Igneacidithiobacillus copahuensis]MBU2755344.1 PIN domain nuclease [Acidithiobacillus sp. CV18-3]MBU2757736.1 PIN domain nuclease [Acidithiobacillus sp. BN09-2]MBU2777322.1 PIN domain nuclease [Acidithiobacillus sp. CV18-2]MBU2797796.1 PIN domain nuclease [Acidithiobacillus sp. VAN18-2]MBU2798557.1 PIN domain nuclease [Acidithiobacillus sp. VAN18-4]UTV80582.1 PIN domain nuclease [Acidithiobacillus sp. YTS05]